MGPKLAPTKGSDDGFFVIDHEPSKNVEIVSLESKHELDGSLNPVPTTPSPSQMLVSVQDQTVAFSVPNSSVMEDRPYQPVAQMSTSPAHQISPPDIVSTKVLPEADLAKSAMSTSNHTPDLSSSSHAGIAATVHDIETDQVGSLSLTRTAIISLDTEQSDSDAAATEVTYTADSLADAMYDDTIPLLSTTAQSTREDLMETEQYSHHEQPTGTVMQSLFLSEDDNSVQGNFRDSALLSSQLTSTGYHSMSGEAEPQAAAASYTGGTQSESDAEISETETENQTTTTVEPENLEDGTKDQTTVTSYTGDIQSNAEILESETENQTTSAVEAEIPEDGTKDQTTATNYTGGSQSDAELSAIDTENQIASVSDTLGDAEMTVVETDNQTTTASYTGGVQNDAEVSNLDLPDSCSGSEEDLDGVLLQDDETKRLLGSYADGTTKVCFICTLALFQRSALTNVTVFLLEDRDGRKHLGNCVGNLKLVESKRPC